MAQSEIFHPPGAAARLFSGIAHGPLRILGFPLLGAVVGLGLAAASLLEPAVPPVTIVPPGYVALVNQQPILMSDYINQTETQENVPFSETTPAQRRATLHDMINEELMVQRGLVLNLPEQDTNVRKELAEGVSAEVVAQRKPAEKDLVAYFNAHRGDYSGDGQMLYHDIVLHVGGYQNADQTISQAEADALEAVYQLQSGAALESVMQHFGFTYSERTQGDEELDFAAKLHLGDKLFAVASKLRDGEISQPVSEPDGVHIIVMDARKPPSLDNYAASRARVFADYEKAQKARVDEDNLKFLRSNAQIILAPGQSE
jgi:parvulin-like peptidyl-prolyl isomerase